MSSESSEAVREVLGLSDRMSRLLDEVLAANAAPRDVWAETWRPPVDLVETPDSFIVRVELAGVSREEVAIEADSRALVIRGEKRFTREVGQQRFHRMECGYGRFERRFSLPVEIEPSAVTAKLEGGVLIVRVPKTAGSAMRRIEIESG